MSGEIGPCGWCFHYHREPETEDWYADCPYCDCGRGVELAPADTPFLERQHDLIDHATAGSYEVEPDGSGHCLVCGKLTGVPAQEGKP